MSVAVRVLVAPQELKGSLSADEAAAAIATGLRRARPGWELDLLPFSDGGPGFLYALRVALGGDVRVALTHDPLGRRVLGRYLWVGQSETCVVEAAAANGLYHLRPHERDALRADTCGVGELIAAAASEAPRRIVIGVGGSATTDGGAGMARALGAELLDAEGRPLPPGGGALRDLAQIRWNPPDWLRQTAVVVATDVTSPLLGPGGAARLFGPQKGATPGQVELLEAALARYAAIVERDLGIAIAELPGGGAAGGLAAGLVAFLGARIVSGFDVVAEATRLYERLAAADLVVTAEGSFDAQSARGKGPGRLLALAERAGKPCVVFAGRAPVADPRVRSLAALEPDTTRSMERAAELLAELAASWAAEVDAGG